jgi:hypothetical protein
VYFCLYSRPEASLAEVVQSSSSKQSEPKVGGSQFLLAGLFLVGNMGCAAGSESLRDCCFDEDPWQSMRVYESCPLHTAKNADEGEELWKVFRMVDQLHKKAFLDDVVELGVPKVSNYSSSSSDNWLAKPNKMQELLYLSERNVSSCSFGAPSNSSML